MQSPAFGPQPLSAAAVVFTQVSPRKTNRSGTQLPAHRALTSGCPRAAVSRVVFFRPNPLRVRNLQITSLPPARPRRTFTLRVCFLTVIGGRFRTCSRLQCPWGSWADFGNRHAGPRHYAKKDRGCEQGEPLTGLTRADPEPRVHPSNSKVNSSIRSRIP